jgi:hypothetical protein
MVIAGRLIMRWTRVAVVLAVITPALGAQQTARPDPPRAGTLEAEVHYSTGSDVWFSTNRPAYVALFDVSRGGVTQLYPTFSAQATELSGTSVRVAMRSAAPLPSGNIFGGSSLVTLNTPVGAANAAGWPHTLLLVASTMPLRVGSTWDSNIAINNDLVRTHQWNDLDTDAGIAAVVDLVRPLDWGAEVATDRVQLATPARYATSLAYDPNQTALGYSCVDANRQFTSPTPQLGAYCVALRELPPNTRAVNASTAAPPAGGIDTTRVLLQSNGSAAAPAASRISQQKHGDVESISDPAAIRSFMESMKTGQGTPDSPRTEGARGDQPHGPPRDASRDASRDQGRDQVHEARTKPDGSGAPAHTPRASSTSTTRPSTPPPAPPEPTKRPNEHE